MIYLSGVIRPELAHPRIGFMRTPRMRSTLPVGAMWAADNGRFNSPEEYSDDGYLDWLDRQERSRCLFAVAPDVVGDHAATVAMSRPLLPRIRAAGYRAAFAAQDGWSEADTPWDEFDVLFIGGTNEFKLGRGGEAALTARRRRKDVHMARVNSYKRLRLAAVLGCGSADGTFLRVAPDHNEQRMLRWLSRLSANGILDYGPSP